MEESTTLPSNRLTRSCTKPSPCTAFIASARRAAAAQSVQSDGFVKDLVNLFDAKVVDSTIKEERK